MTNFFISDSFSDSSGKYRSWNISSGFYNHKAIVLQLDFNKRKYLYPFKFNPTWLSVDEFNFLGISEWTNLQQVVPSHFSPIYVLIFKLSKLRSIFREWEIIEKKKEDDTLCSIEDEICRMEVDLVMDYFCPGRT